MVLQNTTVKSPWQHKIFWEQQIGTKWTNVLTPLLRSPYMHKVMLDTSLEYKLENTTTYPDQKNIFKAFKDTPFEELKVVILGQDPYHDGRAIGLAFANSEEYKEKPSPSLRRIRQQTPSFGVGTSVDLSEWTSQGVLLLNTALTVTKGKPGSHLDRWKKFTEETIRLISENHSGLIFMLWGKPAQQYKTFINENLHYILEAEHPVAGQYQGNRPWDSKNCFEVANEILLKNNGLEELIEW